MGWDLELTPYAEEKYQELERIAKSPDAARVVFERLNRAVPETERDSITVQALNESPDLKLWLQALFTAEVTVGKACFFGRTAYLPVHITLRVLRDVGNLRAKDRFKEIKHAFRLGNDRFGMRLNEFSVQANHLHLIVEAQDKRALARGLQGLAIRVAKAVNRASGGRKGHVFSDRYHAHILKTPSEVRRAFVYVRRNFHKHVKENTGRIVPSTWNDPFSSANEEALWDLTYEDGEIVGLLIIARPTTWLLKHATAPPEARSLTSSRALQ